MRVLITGASGGMAGYVIKQLLDKKIEVIATSRSSEKIKEEKWFGNVDYLPYDLSDRREDNLFSYFQKPDVLIHLAWDKLKEHKNVAHTTTILEDHKLFLHNLISNGLNDITVVGTCYEYGLKEGELKETDPSAPIVPYAIGKNALREYLENLKANFAFSLKWLRVFNVFSEGKSGGNLYSSLINAIKNGEEFFNMSGGEQVRDYLTANEVTDIIVKTALQRRVEGIINCSSGKPVMLKEMLRDFINKNHFRIKLNLGYYPYLTHEPMRHWGSTVKLERILKSQEYTEK